MSSEDFCDFARSLGAWALWILFCALLSRLDAADVARIKTESEHFKSKTDKGEDCIAWENGSGTCFKYGEFIVTCAHVLKLESGRKVVKVQVEVQMEEHCAWIDATVVYSCATSDVAFLKIHKSMKLPEIEGSGLFASIRTAPVIRLKCVGERYPGFDHGGSGAPLYRNGRLEGMARGFAGEGNESEVCFVPASVIESLRPK